MIEMPPTLIPGWKHPETGKVHIREDCRAVMYHRNRMKRVLVRVDLAGEPAVPCFWCFPGASRAPKPSLRPQP